MTTITLIKTTDAENQGDAVENSFRILDAMSCASDADQLAKNLFIRKLTMKGSGVIVTLDARFQRSQQYHRRHMAIERAMFDNQDAFSNFEQFRYWLKIGAGWCTWVAGDDSMIPLPRSISYSDADQAELEQFEALMLEFMRCDYALRYLWPHVETTTARSAVDAIIDSFD